MMLTFFADYVYDFILLLSCVVAFWRYKKLDKATKIIVWLLAVSCISESVAYYFAFTFHNNYPVYNIYSCFELLIICLYFNKSIDVFRRTNVGLYIGIAGFLFGLADLFFIEKGSFYRGYAVFILVENIIIISLCLFALARMSLNREIRLVKQAHFWFAVIFVFFYCLSFFNHYVYDYFAFIDKNQPAETFVIIENLFANIFTYIAFIVVFLLIPKLQMTHE